MGTNNVTDEDEPSESLAEEELQNAEPEKTVQEYASNKKTSRINPEAIKELNPFRKYWALYKSKKKIVIPVTLAVLLLIIMAIPVTRYAVLGLIIKKDINITVNDSQTNIPISGVEINARGQTVKTDAQGNAKLKGVKVGRVKLAATKKYYTDLSSDITLPLSGLKQPVSIKLIATGRQVPIVVTNKITGQNVAGATVRAAETEVQTDQNGAATLVVPADTDKLRGVVEARGYNDQNVDIKVSQSTVIENTFSISPAGKIYFLSKKSGKIDVVKTDLDGGNRQTVLAGTGREEDTNTILLASRDWKYLALLAQREGDKAKLYMIDTGSDKLTEIDGGDATYNLVGWHDHHFIYKVNRNNVLVWQAKSIALKTYNAELQQLNVADETNAEGSGESDYAAESLDNVYILKDKLVYTKRWHAGYYSVYRLSGKRMSINSVKPNGSGRQVIKDFDVGNNGFINAVLIIPGEIYFSVSANNTTSYYEYENGVLAETKELGDESFYKFYPTYLLSPSGQKTIWYEPRDGKNTLFVGTREGGSPKEIARLSEYTPYGWYTDEYFLVSKDGSELFILPAQGMGENAQILKITDYHKPDYSFKGYGYGGH